MQTIVESGWQREGERESEILFTTIQITLHVKLFIQRQQQKNIFFLKNR